MPKLAQDLGMKMGFWHFSKRVFECTFVHFYSKPTKSVNKIIWEMGYTWLFFGIVIPFYLLHPAYNDYLLKSDYLYYMLSIAFIFFEAMNMMCHLHLKSFRKGDLDFTRGIPTQHGFSVVSCANYFWEFLAWLCFTFVNQTLAAFMYCFITFLRMNYRAQKKHLRYIAEFKDRYPAEQRRAFIPYLF